MRNRQEACRSDGHLERGQALFLVLVFMIIILAIGGAIINMANLNTRRVSADRTDRSLTHAARTGLAQAKFMVWENYQTNWLPANSLTPPGNLTNARDYFDDTTAGGGNCADGTLFGPGGTARRVISMQLTGGTVGGLTAGGEPVFVNVLMERHDKGLNTFLVFRSIATVWDTSGSTGGMDPVADRAARATTGLPADQRITEQVLRVGGELYDGFKFALLTNAVNCTFCHADFDNANRFYDPGNPTGYERIKVASLEEMKVGFNNGSGSDTNIAGTLFVQGNIQDIDGDDLDPGAVASFRSRVFDSNFILEEDTTGSHSDPDDYFGPDGVGGNATSQFVDGNKTAGEYDQADANFYKDYPVDPATQEGLAGRLPEVFPPVVSDDDGDRAISDSEWNDHITNGDFTGSIQFGGDSTGVMQIAGTYGSSTLPAAGTNNVTGGVLTGGTTTETTNKNVILIGTETDPIILNGDVAIDGDVVIMGVVQGSGQLLARGNMYILGDLRYNDAVVAGDRQFGIAPITGDPNAVAYAAGGMIIHGEYLQSHIGNDFTGEDPLELDTNSDGTSDDRSFTQNEIGAWNRAEFAKTMPYIDSDTGWPTSNAASQTGSDNTVIGQKNPLYEGATYKPRFYTVKNHEGLNSGDEGPIWIHGAAPYGTGGSSSGSNQNPNEPSSSGSANQYPYSWIRLVDTDGDLTNGPEKALWINHDIQNDAYEDGSARLRDIIGAESGAAGLAVAAGGYATVSMDPSFISQADMRALTQQADNDRAAGPDNGKPYRLDGLFYTNNGMLFMSRSGTYSATADSANGLIEFNGSVVAADTGILAGAHLQLNYDERIADYLKIEDRSTVQLFVVAEREGR